MQEKFLAAVADLLEVDELGWDDEFRQVSGWCSLQAFGLLVMMENDWHAPMTVDDLTRCRTVRDLGGFIERRVNGGR